MPVVDRQFLNQVMYIDLMFVNSISYLVSVTNPLEYVMICKLSRKIKSSLWMNLESVAVWGPRDLGPHSVCLGSYPNTL